MPYPDLVTLLRKALTGVNKDARKLENFWVRALMPQPETSGAKETNRSQLVQRATAREQLNKEQDEAGLTPLESLKRILNIVKEATEAEQKKKVEHDSAETQAIDDSDIILDRADSYLSRFKRLPDTPQTSGAKKVLFKHDTVIKLKQEEIENESPRVGQRRYSR